MGEGMKEMDQQHWINELAECERLLEESKIYGNAGDVQWYEERRRWALHKLSTMERAAGVKHG